MIAQMSKQSNYLYCWDLFVCCNKMMLHNQKVEIPYKDMPPITDLVWTTENTLFLCDVEGNVYMVNY